MRNSLLITIICVVLYFKTDFSLFSMYVYAGRQAGRQGTESDRCAIVAIDGFDNLIVINRDMRCVVSCESV